MEKTKTYKSIVAKINAHIRANSTMGYVNYSRWYVGITNDVKIRKSKHNQTFPNNMYFQFFDAGTMDTANQIEAHFSKNKGTINDSGKGGAKENSIYVYAFKAEPTWVEILEDWLSE